MLIGLGHASRTGKDTCGQILKEYGFTQASFAAPIKSFVYETNPLVRAIVDRIGWEQAKDERPIVRQALVEVANVARDLLGEDVWVRPVLDHLDGPTVITDLRYPNEAEAIHARGGLVVRIIRPGYEALPNVADQALEGYTDWDAEIMNDGSIDDLRPQLDALVAEAGMS